MEDDLEVPKKMTGMMTKNFQSLVDLLLTLVYLESFYTCHKFSQTVALINLSH